MKIIFAIKALGNEGGGAERVLCQVASGLAERGNEVLVLTSDPANTPSYYPLADSVRLVSVGLGDVSRKSRALEVLRRILAWRQLILSQRPDVVVCFMHSTYLPLGVALLGTGIPMVASEHIGPEHYVAHPLERALLRITPVVSVRVTAVSSQIRDSFPAWMRRKMVVVTNPVVVDREVAPRAVGSQGKVLLSVGRLTPQKDQKTLVRAFAACLPYSQDWRLRIVGEGPLRHELESLVKELGVENYVELPGSTAAIHSEYKSADLFVLPSLYESFGLATAEALLHGLPAVGFSDCAGTNELIIDGVNGRLVEGEDRVASLAKVLSGLMSDNTELSRLAGAPRDELAHRFGLSGTMDRWEAVLGDACAHPSRPPQFE